MNKKLLTGLLAVSCLVGLSSCGGYSKEVLADAEHHSWVIHGNNEIKDENGEWIANGWNGKDSALYKASAMTPTSVRAVSEVSEEVAAKLDTKNLKNLYMGEVRLGCLASGWTSNAIKADGKIYQRDGSYCLKAAIMDYIEEDDNYSEFQWISDPKTAHVESLTPETLFYPVWQETADANGFSWKSDPVCIGEAGVYTFIVAQYTEASAPGVPGYGAALVLKEAGTAAKEDVVIETPFADLSKANVGIIGGFADNNWASDVAKLTYSDGKLVGTVTVAEGTSFKFRANDAWDASWGFASLATNADFEDDGGNIKAKVAGTYNVEMTIAPTGLSASIKLTKAA